MDREMDRMEVHHAFSVAEYHSSKRPIRRYRLEGGHLTMVPVGNAKYFSSVEQFFREAFLPEGYPDSVSDDYLTYQKWDTLQAFCSSITGTLATHAVLTGVGVGNDKATAAAATMTWLLKDGAGMIGRITFTWLQGSDLDCNAKKWRFIADIVNDGALFLELISPLFPALFLPILCAASVAKAIVGVAGGATRAALTQHQARRNNMADVSAKDGSQETLVNLSALLVGLILAPLITDNQMLVWLLFAVFTILHLFCNYQAVACVKMEMFNRRRLHLLLKHYFRTGEMLTPAKVNQQEPILTGIVRFLSYELGSELHKVITSRCSLSQLSCGREKLYLVNLLSRQHKVFISLHKDSKPIDQICACAQVEVLEFILTHWNKNTKGYHQMFDNCAPRLFSLMASSNHLDSIVEEELVEMSEKIIKQHLAVLTGKMECVGWITERNLLGPTDWRYEMNDSKHL